MKSVMAHNFSQVPVADIPRSNFNRSSGLKTTIQNGGDLVPIFVDEVLPGDTFNLSASFFARLATPIVPFMDNLFFDTQWFFVPNRLVWDNWQKFNGEQENPGDSTDYLVPTITAPAGGFAVGSPADYFGIPTGIENIEVNALPFRAMNLIWREWYRDENLQDSPVINKGDGPDLASDYPLLKRCKAHDYYTSSLPWPQKGPGLELPITGNAPILGTLPSTTLGYNSSNKANRYQLYMDSSDGSGTYGCIMGNTSTTQRSYGVKTTALDLSGSEMYADMSSIASVTINSLREAFQLQRLLERDARGGTRYTEILRSHFGVISPDARLQRPEYLGGTSTLMNINSIAQTSSTNDVTPQGNLAAVGTGSDSQHIFSKSFTEHGYIIGFANVRADLNYQQGLHKMWTRQTRFDFYWPALAHLGEQAVLNQEIFAQGTAADKQVFGYQERWAELRYRNSIITGKMRSTDPQTLDIWHLAQKFENLPALNSDFIQDNPPLDRVVAVTDEPKILLDCFYNLQCARPMPTYSVPGLIDHF